MSAPSTNVVDRAGRERVVAAEQIGNRVAHQPQIDRAVGGVGPVHHRDQLGRVGRGEDRHVRHRTHDRQVLDVEVGLADCADQQARVGAGDLDVRVALRHQHPDRVERAVGEEHGERRRPRHVADRGQPGCRADQVLLGDAHLEEPVRVGLGELVGLGRVGEITVQDDRPRIAVRRARRACRPTRLSWPSPLLLRSCSGRSARWTRSSVRGRVLVGVEQVELIGSSSWRARSKSSALGTMLCQVCTPSASDRPLPFTVWAMITVGRPWKSPDCAISYALSI